MDSTEYVIRPIKNGFLVQERTSRYYNSTEAAYATWTEVIDSIKDTPVKFIADEPAPAAAANMTVLNG